MIYYTVKNVGVVASKIKKVREKAQRTVQMKTKLFSYVYLFQENNFKPKKKSDFVMN